MKPLDWIILIIAVPLFFLNLFGHINASNHPLVKAGVAEPRATSWHIFFWLCAILFVVWRVGG